VGIERAVEVSFGLGEGGLGEFASGGQLLHLLGAAAHHYHGGGGPGQAYFGLGGVVAALPGGVHFDEVDGYFAQHAVAAG
nr:hypothetical protein [Tanacetum cinerariifolium]